MAPKTRVLLTGATGFVGKHVYPSLVAAGYDVVCGTRDPERAKQDASLGRTCRFDLDDHGSVQAALWNVDRAVFLVHAMSDHRDFAEVERRHAEMFRDAAARCGIERVVYLGGMRPDGAPSPHLKSRLETGEILRRGKTPTVELRATMIVGGGSESFRIVRDLAARLPWMLLPKWLRHESEPVAIDDVAAAIVHALGMPLDGGKVFDMPGPVRLSGREMIERTAGLLGHRPRTVEVPVVTPRLSSYWIRLVTRANPRVAAELVEGLRSDIVSDGQTIWSTMPDHELTGFDEAVRRALREEEETLSPAEIAVERVAHQVARA